MFSIIVITFEALSVLFIGIFARSTATVSTYYDLLESSLVLLLGFTLMYSPFRKFSIFSLVVLLMAISIAVQTDILFGTFWDSCFKGFASSFELSSVLLVKALYASLTVLLTCLDFVGLFDYWQVFMIIAPLMTIGSSLCSSILLYGLKVYDGGGGLTVFFYSGVCSLIIWIVSLRGKIPMNKYKIKESYINHTLAFIGLVISFISWPAFNMAGALVTVVNTIETIGAL